jgi:hypothetical protein
MKNALYDSAVTQNLANRLYAEADTVVIRYTIIGAACFAGIFYFGATLSSNAIFSFSLTPNKAVGLGLLLGVVIGFIAGQRKSYHLMLSAQLALCQIQIERNTREVISEIKE